MEPAALIAQGREYEQRGMDGPGTCRRRTGKVAVARQGSDVSIGVAFLKSPKSRDIAGCIAAILLSAACMIAAIYHTSILLELKHHGNRTMATVVDIQRGAKSSKWAIYRFTTDIGRETMARDKFQQYIKRVRKDNFVTIIYCRDDPQTVTADLGLWIWQGPAIFFGGCLLLAGLAILIWRHRAT